jgi:SAM-dependent methyltransferase
VTGRSARRVDKHVLYQESVQAPEVDSAFLARLFEKHAGRPLRLLREDFCGTALLSCAFVRRHRENVAIGVDLHGPTLAWAKRHNLAKLRPDQRERVRLVRGDVLAVRRPPADLIVAMNFSWYVFKTRAQLSAYVANAKRSLVGGGLLVMDLFGGSDAVSEETERRRQKGFRYVWEQRRFDPVTGEILCAIHFEFNDGSRIRNAFTYDWRLWTIRSSWRSCRSTGCGTCTCCGGHGPQDPHRQRRVSGASSTARRSRRGSRTWSDGREPAGDRWRFPRAVKTTTPLPPESPTLIACTTSSSSEPARSAAR